jgi:hypothetical protein
MAAQDWVLDLSVVGNSMAVPVGLAPDPTGLQTPTRGSDLPTLVRPKMSPKRPLQNITTEMANESQRLQPFREDFGERHQVGASGLKTKYEW